MLTISIQPNKRQPRTPNIIFSGADPAIERLSRFVEILQKESDRGAIVFGVAALDELAREVAIALVQVPGPLKKLLDSSLQAGAKRFQLCSAFGFFVQDEIAVERQLRKIRNKFAHSEIEGFHDEKVKLCVGEITFRGVRTLKHSERFIVIASLSILFAEMVIRLDELNSSRISEARNALEVIATINFIGPRS